MTLKSHHKVVYLLFVGLLLAMLIVPVTTTVVDNKIATGDTPHFTPFQENGMDAAPTTVIACACGDPGGGQGGGCC